MALLMLIAGARRLDEDDSTPELMSTARNQTGLFIGLKIALETIFAWRTFVWGAGRPRSAPQDSQNGF
jgi:hypothetical protein